MYKSIDEVPPQILEAYRDYRYRFDPRGLPSSAHSKWSEVDWINYVRFSPELERLRMRECPTIKPLS